MGLELGSAGGDALLELGIERLELAGLAVELDEHLDLGAQHLRHHRHRDIVDRADLVAAQMVGVGDLHARHEDHGELLEARVLADHGGELEAVDLRHDHVDQDDGDVGLEQDAERLVWGARLDQVLAQLAQYDFVAEQFGRLVVDQQDVDLVGGVHGCGSDRCHLSGAARAAAR